MGKGHHFLFVLFSSPFHRKNPLHFQECSHPGDTDHEEEEPEEEEEESERPECPYGTDCYRCRRKKKIKVLVLIWNFL